MSTKISQLTSAVDVTANDLIQIVDVEDGVMAPSGTNKKATASLLAKELAKQPLEPGVVISGSSTSAAVRITQTGTGNALLVEDSSNPDSTPFRINSNGQVFIGGPGLGPEEERKASIAIVTDSLQSAVNNGNINTSVFSNEQEGTYLRIRKGRGTISVNAIVQNEDQLGTFSFEGYDGVSFRSSSQIIGHVDGDPSLNNIPSRLTFNTTGLGSSTSTERMRITSSGNVGIGTSTPNASCLLDLSSTSRGFRPPSMTTAQRNLIASPAAGVMVYNTTTNKLNFYNGSAWEAVTSAV